MLQFISPPMPHFITCGEDTYPVGGRHASRSSIGVFDLLMVTRGCLHLEEEGTHYPIPAGHFALLRPDRAHRTMAPCEEETHFYWLHFHTFGDWSEEKEKRPIIPPPRDPYMQLEAFAFYLPRSGQLQDPGALADRMKQLLLHQLQPTGSARWLQQQLFQDLLLQLQEESGMTASSPHLIIADEAAAFLKRHYKEPLGYKRMSEELHFHANYIAICMKKAYGCTPLEYVTRYRVEQAKRMLIHSNLSIGRIAEETGFGSFPYFIRCFSRSTGFKPKEFRMRYR
ncbi:helix-turn-helix transcriptional regulator [Paenibacillus nasutitermitis]|uniref:HTH-type transcriptional regulator YisR n=1 Tax=Paenibacillus nasutitermitis TaxID=1652958 RepID=A0A916YLF8_9BACL|nr:AraC family transcriptional regulator [Paenibacillus nasutitermitis]GGD51041.1 putative HTH-type transcriptional regulator YisR [Paenibacillus nasutitermitis]